MLDLVKGHDGGKVQLIRKINIIEAAWTGQHNGIHDIAGAGSSVTAEIASGYLGFNNPDKL